MEVVAVTVYCPGTLTTNGLSVLFPPARAGLAVQRYVAGLPDAVRVTDWRVQVSNVLLALMLIDGAAFTVRLTRLVLTTGMGCSASATVMVSVCTPDTSAPTEADTAEVDCADRVMPAGAAQV